jgi:hypothetical protein
MEEEEMMRGELKMPEDLVGGDDEYGEEFDEEGSQAFGEQVDKEREDAADLAEQDDDVENEVFAAARENAEMAVDAKRTTFANQDMVEKIEKIEDQMMD